MQRSLLCCAAIALLGACNVKPAVNPNASAPKPADTSTAEVKEEKTDIGDIEQTLELELTIPEKTRPPQVSVEELRTPTKKLSIVSAQVNPPAPGDLWLNFKIAGRADYRKQPFVLRGAILRATDAVGREAQPIAKFSTVMYKDWDGTAWVDGKRLGRDEIQVNAASGLPGFPQTMLLHVEAEAILLPESVDAAKVDSETYQGEPDATTKVMSNPLRINLAGAGAAN